MTLPHNQSAANEEGSGLSRGTNQTALRVYNERLILSLIRRHNALPKAEIARLTGLSAQTVSVIMRRLERDELVVREAPLRGRIGQPSVPYSLHRNGAASIGLKIGRRSAELILMDFVGETVRRRRRTYRYPTVAETTQFLKKGIDAFARDKGIPFSRSCGLGVAMPSELWSWAEEIDAPPGVMDEWKEFRIEETFGALSGLPVHVSNDATAACGAELIFGRGATIPDFLYVFIGTFVGGGLVLDGRLYTGGRGNAGAVGSILVPGSGAKDKSAQQLIQSASIYVLEKRLTAGGSDRETLRLGDPEWRDIGAPLEEWIEEAAGDLAVAIANSVAILDVETVIIDGAVPEAILARIVERTRQALDKTETKGLLPVDLMAGSLGDPARVMGAAALPLMANFARDSQLLLKDNRLPA